MARTLAAVAVRPILPPSPQDGKCCKSLTDNEYEIITRESLLMAWFLFYGGATMRSVQVLLAWALLALSGTLWAMTADDLVQKTGIAGGLCSFPRAVQGDEKLALELAKTPDLRGSPLVARCPGRVTHPRRRGGRGGSGPISLHRKG